MEQGFASPSKCLVEWGAIPRFAQGMRMRALQLNLEALGFCIFIFMYKRKSIGFDLLVGGVSSWHMVNPNCEQYGLWGVFWYQVDTFDRFPNIPTVNHS